MFCSSIDDLDRHFAVVNAQLDGNANPPPEPPGCRIIQTPTAVTVLDRQSRGHTEVKLSQAPGLTGWTDTFLPEKGKVAAPPSNVNAPGL